MTALLIPYKNILPRIGKNVFTSNAVIAGDVEIGDDSSIWYNCVIRGDVNSVKIGQRSNIQDGTVIHVSSFGLGTIIGDDVTVGHMAMLHACTIEDGAFLGMKACIMDGAVVEKGAMVAAGALVTLGKRVPSGQLWGGSPAKFMRELSAEDKKHMEWSSAHYVKLAKNYL
jgi:carbonic anhydrase/acetyltransferase-like protein (isoleucine patch superfamily)